MSAIFLNKVKKNKYSLLFYELWETASVNFLISESFIDKFIIDNVQEQKYNNLCCICLDDFENINNRLFFNCGHCFHIQCIMKLLLTNNCNNCPYCRTTDIFSHYDSIHNRYLQLLGTLYITLNSVEACFLHNLKNIERQIECNNDLDNFYKNMNTSEIIRNIKNLMLYISLNKEGITIILKHFDKKTNATITEPMTEIFNLNFKFYNEASIHDKHKNKIFHTYKKYPTSLISQLINKMEDIKSPKIKCLYFC